MLMANQNLLQKHARNLIYAINPNATGYIGLFFLTEKIYDKMFLGKGLIWGDLIFKKNVLSLTKNRKKPKLEVHCTQVYWSDSAWFSSIFPQSQLRYQCNALKLNKSTHQYVAMATAEPIRIFSC